MMQGGFINLIGFVNLIRQLGLSENKLQWLGGGGGGGADVCVWGVLKCMVGAEQNFRSYV